MSEQRSATRTSCPSCKKIIDLDRRYQRKELITCPHCKQVLEVIRVFPQVVDFPLNTYPPRSSRGRHRLK